MIIYSNYIRISQLQIDDTSERSTDFDILTWQNLLMIRKSCGLAVEHSAHDQKVVGLIPVQC